MPRGPHRTVSCELRLSTSHNHLAENGVAVNIEELISNRSTASTTAASFCVQGLETAKASKSRISRADKSICQEMAVLNPLWVMQGAVAHAELRNVHWQKLSRNPNSKCNALSDRCLLCQVSHDAHL